MLARISLLLLLAFALAGAKTTVELVGERVTETQFPTNIKKLKSLQEFVKLVDEHQMNVTVIGSEAKYWENGNLEEILGMGITFPVNSVIVTENKPKNLDPLLKAAYKDKLAVAATTAANNKLHAVTNSPGGIPVHKVLKTFMGIKNGKTGFAFDEENYIAQYTLISQGEDGKNLTTKVLYADASIDVVKSSNLKPEEIDIIKQAVIDVVFSYKEEVAAKPLVVLLTKKLPGHDWNVVFDVEGNIYVDASKWIQLKFAKEDFFVYAL